MTKIASFVKVMRRQAVAHSRIMWLCFVAATLQACEATYKFSPTSSVSFIKQPDLPWTGDSYVGIVNWSDRDQIKFDLEVSNSNRVQFEVATMSASDLQTLQDATPLELTENVLVHINNNVRLKILSASNAIVFDSIRKTESMSTDPEVLERMWENGSVGSSFTWTSPSNINDKFLVVSCGSASMIEPLVPGQVYTVVFTRRKGSVLGGGWHHHIGLHLFTRTGFMEKTPW